MELHDLASSLSCQVLKLSLDSDLAEAAQRRASLSKGEQLVLMSLEAVMFGLALASTGAEVAGAAAPRGLTGAEALEFVRKNPGSLERALVDGFKSEVGRAITDAERTQLTTALREYLPQAEAGLAAGNTPSLFPEGYNPLQLPAPKAGGAAAQAATQAKGGTYILRDPPLAGSCDLVARTTWRDVRQNIFDPALKDYTFEVVNRTDVYAEQRSLEQILHETHNPPLIKIGGIDPKTPGCQSTVKRPGSSWSASKEGNRR